MSRPNVFISYSHDSPEHVDRVLALADRLIQDGINCTLDQYEISPPEGWPKWMDRHIAKSDFVIVVCTEAYYRRVMGEEEPGRGRGVRWESTLAYQHIYSADAETTRFIPVLFKSGKAEYIPTPLQGATYYPVDTEQGYEDLYRRLTDQPRTIKPKLGKLRRLPPRGRKPDFLTAEVAGPDKISISRLPITGRNLFGRQAELGLLDQAWADTGTNVLSLVAWGGVGKSALVNHWLRGMAGDHYRGAKRVYGWSFYSQGTSERAVSADLFIASALTWFGDPDPTQGSPWDKGERLARLVKAQRTLLLLDGLEPLQFPPGPQEGKLKDQALQALLRELAALNPGLCVISTRLPVTDLEHFQGSTARRINLEHLSPQAGAEILKAQGLKGDQADLEQAASDFGGHALALTLLGSLLRDAYDGDVRCRGEVGSLEEEMRHGGHARRVMASYEKWFGAGPELAVLRMLGLFNRPADGPAVAVLSAPPAIPGLTDRLQDLSERDWRLVLAKLRRAGLLAEKDPAQPDILDGHPLVREHFGQRLRQEQSEAWREGNNRLYEHLKAVAPELPDTIEEMAPLYAAVAHGCQALRYQETYDEVYRRRICRGNEYFNSNKLGAIAAELSVLAGFFEPLWRKCVQDLRADSKGAILNQSGFCLRALGRLAEAAQPMQAGLEAAIAREHWTNAAQAAENLSELYLTSGDLAHAAAYAQQDMNLADRSGDGFRRMASRTTLADGLHQAGRLAEAEAAFREAEEMQKENQPQFPLLYSLQGFRYCDLLLGQGKYREVQSRAGQTLEWVKQGGLGLLTIALDHLSLGRAHLLQARQEGTGPSAEYIPSEAEGLRISFSQAAAHLERAVDGLRQAGTRDHLPRGLLARAELRRAMGSLDRARADLEEALSIATRGGMRLFEADCHLEYVRLHLACGEQENARESLAKAKGMVEEMGYHRRGGEVAELEGELEPLRP